MSGGVSGSEEIQAPTAEQRFAAELAFLASWDTGPRPPGWRLTPRAVLTFIVGSETLKLPSGLGKAGAAATGLGKAGEAATGLGKAGEAATARVESDVRAMAISEKFVGSRALVERSIVTLAGERGLLLVGEPGTAKSMLSELLAAAISGSSARTVQGTAGTTEDQLRYGWNYALLLAQGPTQDALVPSPVLSAMRLGELARIEEITRCLPEVQDALVSILSDRRMQVPELGRHEAARPGFNLIATANLRDKGVSEMSAALKRRFNFETVPPIPDLAREVALVRRQATAALERAGVASAVDESVLEALVTVFRDLRSGVSVEGWAVERPSTVMSTAEAVGIATSLGLQAAYYPSQVGVAAGLPGYLLGVVTKDEPKDRGRLLGYWDAVVKRRAEGQARLWRELWELRGVLESEPT